MAPNIVGLAFGFVLFGSFLLIPQLLELSAATGYGFGKTVTQAGGAGVAEAPWPDHRTPQRAGTPAK
jgi:hypothetical protein